ncbi:PadR family transcriptional regulator [Dictyobacter arantiisoli]|uniref:PadR family transcriptional regulator n=1 Tax=Dictyobacter arantiisoli TaxID=2014874 RepID=A0A5A5T5R8_9CHLR|nr:PadR family transcriptional regulator [Dictyobacter arantiisoli]GCF06697.1 PadR family transcriptional regulator [Dictyobacter arantiisoli]
MQISEPAEYVILGLLQTRSMHGYEMFQLIENGILGQIIHLEMSQMYAFLKKLERLHYIEAELSMQGTRPPRKIFHLTTMGQTIFHAWVAQPEEKPRDIRIFFLLKLYFMQQSASTEQIAHLLQQQIQACQNFLIHLQAQEYATHLEQTDDATFFGQVVLNSRIHQTRALLTWLDELQSAIAQSRQE